MRIISAKILYNNINNSKQCQMIWSDLGLELGLELGLSGLELGLSGLDLEQ